MGIRAEVLYRAGGNIWLQLLCFCYWLKNTDYIIASTYFKLLFSLYFVALRRRCDHEDLTYRVGQKRAEIGLIYWEFEGLEI